MASVDTRSALTKHFSALSQQTLSDIAAYLHLASENTTSLETNALLELLVGKHERRQSQLEAINAMPLYPTEDILWDVNIVPSEYYDGEGQGFLICYHPPSLILSLVHCSLSSSPQVESPISDSSRLSSQEL